MNTVAVYGSLLSGLHNHHLLVGSQKLGDSVVAGFEMYSLGGFPALTPCEQYSEVNIEVYSVDDTTMQRLDRLEGYPDFYDRQEVQVQVNGGTETAWIYFIENLEPHTEVPVINGDWREFYNSRGNL